MAPNSYDYLLITLTVYYTDNHTSTYTYGSVYGAEERGEQIADTHPGVTDYLVEAKHCTLANPFETGGQLIQKVIYRNHTIVNH